MNIVEIKNLNFEYPVEKGRTPFKLNVTALEIEKGSSTALFGKSGSGKSTLLRICAGLQKGFCGRVSLFGSPLDPARRGRDGHVLCRTAILFQDTALFDCGVRENISIGLKIRKTPPGDIERAVDEIVEKMNISGIAGAHAKEISGGQARRVCLARVLALKPELLFLDEPFYSLDASNRAQIMHELKTMCAGMGTALMLVTHDRHEALALCERMTVIDGGAVIRRGLTRECLNEPASEAEARLLGRDSIFYGRVMKCESEVAEIECGVEGAAFRVQAAGVYPPGARACVIINPQDVSVDLQKGPPEGGDGSSSVLNGFAGIIESASHYEFGMLLEISVGAGVRLRSYITMKSWEKLGLVIGSRVNACVKATSVKTFLMP